MNRYTENRSRSQKKEANLARNGVVPRVSTPPSQLEHLRRQLNLLKRYFAANASSMTQAEQKLKSDSQHWIQQGIQQALRQTLHPRKGHKGAFTEQIVLDLSQKHANDASALIKTFRARQRLTEPAN